MRSMKRWSLIGVQDDALARLGESRSSDSRYRRLQGAVRREYAKRVAHLGFTEEQIRASWRDVLDMRDLQRVCEG